jgi:hypothetical protein
VSVDLYSRPPSAEINRYDVEPARAFAKSVPRQEIRRHVRDAMLLPTGHRRCGPSERIAGPGLDFDEDNSAFMPCDDVDFAEAGAIPAPEYCVPAPPQLRAREIFAQLSQGLSVVPAHPRAESIFCAER